MASYLNLALLVVNVILIVRVVQLSRQNYWLRERLRNARQADRGNPQQLLEK